MLIRGYQKKFMLYVGRSKFQMWEGREWGQFKLAQPNWAQTKTVIPKQAQAQ